MVITTEINNLISRDVEVLGREIQRQKCALPVANVKRNLQGNNKEILVTNKIIEGDIVLAKLRKALDCLTTLTKLQRILITIFTQANLPNIYKGKSYEENETRIKEENLMDELYQMAFVCCPRRFGKTWVVSWFVACYLVSVPNARVVVFSPGKRQSMDIMELIRGFLEKLKTEHDFHFDILMGLNNQERLGIQVNGNKRVVRGLPSKEETTRGAGGDLIILEETAAMEEKFVWRVVGPVLGVDNTCLICISTTQGNDNFYDKMLDSTLPNGKPLFNTFRFYLACDACMKNGTAAMCKHKLHELPSWMSATKNQLIRTMYIQQGKTDLLEQETMGVGRATHENAFSHQLINDLYNEDKTPVFRAAQLDVPPKIIFISIDPSAGGKGSDLAIVSAFYSNTFDGMYVICGMDSIPAKVQSDYMDRILDHMVELRKLPKLQHCVFVLIVESNNGICGREIIINVQQSIKNVIILSKRDFDISNIQLNHQPYNRGLQTTDFVKENMYTHTKEFLIRQKIRFYEEMVSVYNENKVPQDELIHDIKQAHKKQFLSYNIIRKVPNDANFNKIKITYSGKSAGKDDLCVGTQLNIFWSLNFIKKELFVQHVKQYEFDPV